MRNWRFRFGILSVAAAGLGLLHVDSHAQSVGIGDPFSDLVYGESMGRRVIPFAEQHSWNYWGAGANWTPHAGALSNLEFTRYAMDQGARFHIVGPDPVRRGRSPYFEWSEVREMANRGYENFIKHPTDPINHPTGLGPLDRNFFIDPASHQWGIPGALDSNGQLRSHSSAGGNSSYPLASPSELRDLGYGRPPSAPASPQAGAVRDAMRARSAIEQGARPVGTVGGRFVGSRGPVNSALAPKRGFWGQGPGSGGFAGRGVGALGGGLQAYNVFNAYQERGARGAMYEGTWPFSGTPMYRLWEVMLENDRRRKQGGKCMSMDAAFDYAFGIDDTGHGWNFAFDPRRYMPGALSRGLGWGQAPPINTDLNWGAPLLPGRPIR